MPDTWIQTSAQQVMCENQLHMALNQLLGNVAFGLCKATSQEKVASAYLMHMNSMYSNTRAHNTYVTLYIQISICMCV